jgi:hypothetical protein
MRSHTPRTKEEAHNEALAHELNKQYTIAQNIELIIIESPSENNGRDAFARHDDVAVFVRSRGLNLYTGTHVTARVSEIANNHLKAVAVAVLD